MTTSIVTEVIVYQTVPSRHIECVLYRKFARTRSKNLVAFEISGKRKTFLTYRYDQGIHSIGKHFQISQLKTKWNTFHFSFVQHMYFDAAEESNAVLYNTHNPSIRKHHRIDLHEEEEVIDRRSGAWAIRMKTIEEKQETDAVYHNYWSGRVTVQDPYRNWSSTDGNEQWAKWFGCMLSGRVAVSQRYNEWIFCKFRGGFISVLDAIT